MYTNSDNVLAEAGQPKNCKYKLLFSCFLIFVSITVRVCKRGQGVNMLRGSYTFKIVELKAFQRFSRLSRRKIQGYFLDKKHTQISARRLPLADLQLAPTTMDDATFTQRDIFARAIFNHFNEIFTRFCCWHIVDAVIMHTNINTTLTNIQGFSSVIEEIQAPELRK